MTLRFAAFSLVCVSIIGCQELVQRLAKKGDDGGPVASAETPPTATPAGTDAPPPTATTTAVATAPAGKTTAAAKPAGTAASAADLEKAFAALDINDDQQLDGIEVKTCGCAVADANGDGEITKAEYLAAGLLGKFRPGAIPTSTAKTTPTNAPTPSQPTPPPPPAPVAGGLPPGDYRCSALVGGILSTMGTLRIIDGSRYSAQDGSGAGNYTFDPGTKAIRFTSGMYAAPDTVKSAQQISDRLIRLRQGKSGFTVTDCKR